MTDYSVADAKARLSELIDRALEGEGVTITRHGKPVVEIKPVAKKPGPITKADIDWLEQRLVGKKTPKMDSGTLVRRMRDEDWE
jgi:prevent-host-death family protein